MWDDGGWITESRRVGIKLHVDPIIINTNKNNNNNINNNNNNNDKMMIMIMMIIIMIMFYQVMILGRVDFITFNEFAISQHK